MTNATDYSTHAPKLAQPVVETASMAVNEVTTLLFAESKPHNRQPQPKESRKGHIRKTAVEELEDSTSSDDEFFEHLKRAKSIKSVKEHNKTITLRLDDVDVRIQPDSGADVNITDEHQFKAFVHCSKKTKQLHKRDEQVKVKHAAEQATRDRRIQCNSEEQDPRSTSNVCRSQRKN